MSKYVYIERQRVRERMRDCRRMFRKSLCVYVALPSGHVRNRSESY